MLLKVCRQRAKIEKEEKIAALKGEDAEKRAFAEQIQKMQPRMKNKTKAASGKNPARAAQGTNAERKKFEMSMKRKGSHLRALVKKKKKKKGQGPEPGEREKIENVGVPQK